MRRLLSLCLFVATLLPLLTPMLSAEAVAEVGVAACCRRGGAHHCMGGMVAAPSDGAARLRGPREICPYQQRGLVAAGHHGLVGSALAAARVQGVLHAPGTLAQVECMRRIWFDRSRQKRGPPVFFS